MRAGTFTRNKGKSLKLNIEILKTQIELFGLVEGLKLFFEWAIKWPIQDWVWLNITRKPYCTYHGWVCEKGCACPKLLTKEEILKHREERYKEMKKVEVGPNGMCVYCGEFKGIETIPDPNGGLGVWKVCVTCKKVINAQHKLSMGHMILTTAKADTEREIANKMIKEAQEEIDFLSAESFMPTFTATIRRIDDD